MPKTPLDLSFKQVVIAEEIGNLGNFRIFFKGKVFRWSKGRAAHGGTLSVANGDNIFMYCVHIDHLEGAVKHINKNY